MVTSALKAAVLDLKIDFTVLGGIGKKGRFKGREGQGFRLHFQSITGVFEGKNEKTSWLDDPREKLLGLHITQCNLCKG